MTNEEKAKEITKDYAPTIENLDAKNVLYDAVMEMAEWKDKQFNEERKELKDYLGKRPLKKKISESDAVNQWIDWIEKQREQKETPCYKPKDFNCNGNCEDCAYKSYKCWLEYDKGEQKPTDKIGPFDRYEGLTGFEKALADICEGWLGMEIGWKQYIKNSADILLNNYLKKWNKEDENMMDSIIECIDGTGLLDSDQIAWLKSIKSRPKQEWSEEDEKIVEIMCKDADLKPSEKNWLKSLKDRI